MSTRRAFSFAAVKRAGWLRSTALGALWLVLPALPAQPHTHHNADGTTVTWYPRECCNDRDCQPVLQVRPTAGGLWLTVSDGRQILVRDDTPRRTSQDTRWHVCIAIDLDNNLHIQCLFQPPGSS